MLYALTAADTMRLRQLLAAYERGRLRQNTRQQFDIPGHQNDYQILNVGSSIVSGALGTGLIVSLDDSATPVQTTQSGLPTLPVYNPLGFTLAAGVYLCSREPSQGYYVPMPCCNSGSSGSGSGTGSGSTFTSNCLLFTCTRTELPTTVYVTMTVTGNPIDPAHCCANPTTATIPCTWQGNALSYWLGISNACNCTTNPMTLQVTCGSGQISVGWASSCFYSAVVCTILSCDPLHATGTTSGGASCGGQSVTVDVTE